MVVSFAVTKYRSRETDNTECCKKNLQAKKPGSLSYDLQNLIIKDSISIFIITNFILGQNISAIYKEFSNQDL